MRVWMVVALLSGLAGCTALVLGDGASRGTVATAERSPRSAEQVAVDNALTARVRTRFNEDPALSQYDLRIETYNGRVTLHGKVSSYSMRDRAVQVAAAVDGVERVSNLIQVVAGT